MMLALGAAAEGTAPLPLRRYEGGGVANSPQLALFGEGKNPEAYVPLPDGRSIPVSIDAPKAPGFAGPAAATFVNSPQVIVNVQGGAGSPQDHQALAEQIGKEIEIALGRCSLRSCGGRCGQAGCCIGSMICLLRVATGMP